jgi:pimeloyl-ACP methyl ester carboxylesterase
MELENSIEVIKRIILKLEEGEKMNNMTENKLEKKVNTLKVPGASIYYEVRGSGPLLLLISGGSGDASSFNILLNYLTDQYTVVTYDRRGYKRSKIDEPSQELQMETESNDIHHLFTALSYEEAYIFGSSLGAAIALDFVSRYPEQARSVVAHEPPEFYLTSNEAENIEFMKSIKKISQQQGETAGKKAIAEMVGVKIKNTKAQDNDNSKFFLEKELPMINNYRFDFNGLKNAMNMTPIVIGAGSTSPKDSPNYLGANAISQNLGIDLTMFPGDHVGWAREPMEFTKKLTEILK